MRRAFGWVFPALLQALSSPLLSRVVVLPRSQTPGQAEVRIPQAVLLGVSSAESAILGWTVPGWGHAVSDPG